MRTWTPLMTVEEGKAGSQLAGGRTGVDECVICGFIIRKGYKKRVMGFYLDDKEIECCHDASTE